MDLNPIKDADESILPSCGAIKISPGHTVMFLMCYLKLLAYNLKLIC